MLSTAALFILNDLLLPVGQNISSVRAENVIYRLYHR